MDDNATKDDLQDILTQTEETIRLLCYDIDSETMRMYDIEAQLRESRQRLKGCGPNAKKPSRVTNGPWPSETRGNQTRWRVFSNSFVSARSKGRTAAMDIEQVMEAVKREKAEVMEDEQPETDVEEPTTGLIERFANKAQSIYLRRTAGELTWEGLLYSFLEQYRQIIEANWEAVEAEEEVPVFVEGGPVEPWMFPEVRLTRTLEDDSTGTPGIHHVSNVNIRILARDEEVLMQLLENHFGRRF